MTQQQAVPVVPRPHPHYRADISAAEYREIVRYAISNMPDPRSPRGIGVLRQMLGLVEEVSTLMLASFGPHAVNTFMHEHTAMVEVAASSRQCTGEEAMALALTYRFSANELPI